MYFIINVIIKGQLYVFYKSEKGYIFGGYASVDWISFDSYRSDPDSFILTLTNMYNIAPNKFPNSDKNKSIWDHSGCGPIFGGHDICICFDSDDYIKFPISYKDILNKGYSIFKGDNDNIYFTLKGIEVFKLIK